MLNEKLSRTQIVDIWLDSSWDYVKKILENDYLVKFNGNGSYHKLVPFKSKGCCLLIQYENELVLKEFSDIVSAIRIMNPFCEITDLPEGKIKVKTVKKWENKKKYVKKKTTTKAKQRAAKLNSDNWDD